MDPILIDLEVLEALANFKRRNQWIIHKVSNERV